MNYTLTVFDNGYAQIHLDRTVGGPTKTTHDLGDLADPDIPIQSVRLLGIPGVCSVSVLGNVVGIEKYDDERPWTNIAHRAAVVMTSCVEDGTLVRRISNEEFLELFPYYFSPDRLVPA